MLERRNPSSPPFDFDDSSVRFKYEAEVLGASFLPKPIQERVKQMFGRFVTQVQAKAPDDHFAFGLKIRQPDAASVVGQMIDDLDGHQLAAAGDASSRMGSVLKAVAGPIQDRNVRRLISAVLASDPREVRADKVIQDRILKEFKLTSAELHQWYVPGYPILRFQNTPIAGRFEQLLNGVAMGNNGRVDVARLDFDLTSYSLSVVIKVRYRHSWGSLRQILGL